MIYTLKSPVEMGIYVNSSKKSIASIKKELNADVISNFQMYNGNWTACCFCKANGKVIGNDGYMYEGYGWNNDSGCLTFDTSANHERYNNFSGCLTIVRNGKYTNPTIQNALSGTRGRTAIGVKEDGTIVLYCVPDGVNAKTIPALGQAMIDTGCVTAINFDGGSKSQCITPSGSVSSKLNVHTYFYARLTEAVKSTTDSTDLPILEKGSKSTAVRSLQFLLISNGYSVGRCGADGDFGAGTQSALKKFQTSAGLNATGVADAVTWFKLICGK